MKIQETLKSATIVLDCDGDFTKEKFKELFTKIKNFKRLPFHDVTLTMPSRYFVRFWDLKDRKEHEDWKHAEVKHDQFTIRY